MWHIYITIFKLCISSFIESWYRSMWTSCTLYSRLSQIHQKPSIVVDPPSKLHPHLYKLVFGRQWDKHQRLLVPHKLRTIPNARSRTSQPQAQISWAPSLDSWHSKPIAIVEDCHCVGCFHWSKILLPEKTFPSCTKVKALPMNVESRPLLTDGPVEFDKYPSSRILENQGWF